MQTLRGESDRIEVIDVLRGFTLFGIILVHFNEQYYAGIPPKTHENFLTHNLADTIVSGFIGLLISGKFFMIFSFLFGMSFFIQLAKSDGSPTFLLRFAWRLIVLFLIGFIHHLHYRGDILTIYAVLGFGLLLAYKLPDKALLALALILVFNLPSLGTRAYDVIVNPTAENAIMNPDQKELEVYYNTVKSGNYLDILKANFYEFKGKFEFQVFTGRLYITLGLFLLGLYAGRKKIFDNPLFFKKLIRYGLWTLLGCVVTAGLIALIVFAAKIEMTMPMQFLLGGTVLDVFNAALAAIYVGLIVTLFQKEKWRPRLMIFYEVGRMGLTTYLLQAVIGTLLLFSYGLGLLGNYGATVWAIASVVIFYLQIQSSKWWLYRFQYGPAEWLWRSLTYLKVQPLRKR
ncbi:MAG: DUF418 domain-containing protein [Cyclobacteriaceae bacterium]|nr:DUF418 domain-containing protein [Cyclobacteriaceae bacterium]